MKTHFDPYLDIDDDPDEVASCGTKLGYEFLLTSEWSKVTCNRCLRLKERITDQHNKHEEVIVRQMGDMADFFSKAMEG